MCLIKIIQKKALRNLVAILLFLCFCMSCNSEVTITKSFNIETQAPLLSTDLSNWFNKGLSNKKICFIGDSTTSNAIALFNEINNLEY